MTRIPAVAGILLHAGLLFSQPPAPAFEVASIKLSKDSTDHSSGIRTQKGRINAENVTLRRCMRGAYGVPETLIFGGPKWIDDLRFDIIAKADAPADDPELNIMLQSLLADRFKLAFHRETRTMPGYALVMMKSGTKATPSLPDTEPTTNWQNSDRKASIKAAGSTLRNLADKLADVLHVPVTDATGTNGKFDFTLEWTPEDMHVRAPGAPVPDAASGPSLFTALQEQLGLKLESRKVPGEVLVIDHAELPSEN